MFFTTFINYIWLLECVIITLFNIISCHLISAILGVNLYYKGQFGTFQSVLNTELGIERFHCTCNAPIIRSIMVPVIAGHYYLYGELPYHYITNLIIPAKQQCTNGASWCLNIHLLKQAFIHCSPALELET